MVDQQKADTFAQYLGFSGFGAVLPNPGGSPIVISTDGVGTKLLLAEHFENYGTVGIDLVAMCVNDLLCCGAEPTAFMDYYATGDLNLDKSKEIISGIQVGCKIAGCELVGGETAQLKPMFLKDEWFDLAGFAVGFQRKQFGGIRPGDYLVGIPSSGLHSNGFTTIREFYSDYPTNFLDATRIYTEEVLENIQNIKAAAHITGGGIHANLERVLEGKAYTLELPEMSDFWKEIQSHIGYSLSQMQSTFNCGWGMILVVENPEVLHGLDLQVLGRVMWG